LSRGEKGKLLVFSAPSGGGKTTIVRYILKKFPELVFSVSATTRKKRATEVEGKDYFFISEEEFKKKIENDEFVEWEKFYDYYYGTLKSFVNDNLAMGKNVVLELDVKGALNIRKQYPDAVLIFISPPSLEILKERLKKRNTETEEDFRKRIERAGWEIEYSKYFDYVITNDDLEKAKQKAEEIVKKVINKE
jgi:guanylate kinase